ncbi:hypothetical protein V1503_20500 [Bacillus sp. SCS-151]|uniref:hypothetical protein n=1 Tax=Nanhaiella sioensis TaxID=3115293 RepID=UPI003978F7F5
MNKCKCSENNSFGNFHQDQTITLDLGSPIPFNKQGEINNVFLANSDTISIVNKGIYSVTYVVTYLQPSVGLSEPVISLFVNGAENQGTKFGVVSNNLGAVDDMCLQITGLSIISLSSGSKLQLRIDSVDEFTQGTICGVTTNSAAINLIQIN